MEVHVNMERDGKCIWEYYDGKCDNVCENCSHYRPDYKGLNRADAIGTSLKIMDSMCDNITE